MSTLIRVSSNDRNENLAHESAEYFSTELEVPYKIHATQLITANIPNTFYNISLGTFTFEITFHYPGSPPTATHEIISGTIPPGNYDFESLRVAFIEQANLAMAAISALNGLSINPTTSTFGEQNHKLTLNFDTPSSWSTGYPAFDYFRFDFSNIDIQENEVLHHLGWRDTVNHLHQTASSLVKNNYTPIFVLPVKMEAPYTPELSYHRIVEIHSPELAEAAPGNRPIIGEVAMTQEYGDICYYTVQSDTMCLNEYASPRFINEISFSLCDQNGNLINNNNHDWSALIRVYYST